MGHDVQGGTLPARRCRCTWADLPCVGARGSLSSAKLHELTVRFAAANKARTCRSVNVVAGAPHRAAQLFGVTVEEGWRLAR